MGHASSINIQNQNGRNSSVMSHNSNTSAQKKIGSSNNLRNKPTHQTH